MKLIIFVGGRPNIYGYKRNDFKWSEEHQVFIYEGRELEAAEFNDIFAKVFSRYCTNPDLLPRVRITGLPVAAPASETLDLPREVTVEEAQKVLESKAPELLKKQKRKAA